MKMRYINSSGVSETVSVILVIILVVGLAIAVYTMIFGSVNPYMTKTTRVAASAGTSNVPLDTSSSLQIMRVVPMAGEQYYIKGQKNLPANTANTAIASFTVMDPKGQTSFVTNGNISTSINRYGTPIYIYKDQTGNYRLTDSLNSISYAPAQLTPIASGDYKITMVDNSANVPLTIMEVRIAGNGDSSSGSLSRPLLNTLPNSTWTTSGGVTNRTDASGLTLYSFNGIDGYMSATSNPALAFTTDMSLSLWMNPTSTGAATSSSNWHTIIGKGKLNSDNTEYDNYQLMQLGDKLLFEWNDATTSTHYQAITTTSPITAGTLQYVTLSVSGGVLDIKVNGVSQSLSYKEGNVPFSGSTIPAPVVTLENNGNNLLTGKQNSANSAYYFYYKGEMSDVALYNRAITSSEIAHNLQYIQI
jgi:hypothetical protein